MSLRSSLGFTQEATASQKNMKSWRQKTKHSMKRHDDTAGREIEPYDMYSCRPQSLTCTTPPGFTPIIMQIPRKAESFSSLSRMLRSDVHLQFAKMTKHHINQVPKTEINGPSVPVWDDIWCRAWRNPEASVFHCGYFLISSVSKLHKEFQYCKHISNCAWRTPSSLSPGSDKLRQHGSHLLRTHVAQSANCDGWKRRKEINLWEYLLSRHGIMRHEAGHILLKSISKHIHPSTYQCSPTGF